MAYYTGSAADMAAVRTALIDHAQLAGWAWSAGAQELSKAGAVLYVPAVASNKLLVTGRTASGAGSAPNAVGIDGNGIGGVAVTWPAVWHLHAVGSELFFIINYGDRYQWLFAGAATVSGLPGTGMAVAGSCSSITPTNGVYVRPGGLTSTNPYIVQPVPFFSAAGATGSSNANHNWYVHANLDARGWSAVQTDGNSPLGVRAAAPLLQLIPSAWSSEAVLIPVRAYMVRAAQQVSLTAELGLLRWTRNDNYVPGEIVTIGSDRWRIYPGYCRSTAERDGPLSILGGQHTGTLAIAVRYDGP